MCSMDIRKKYTGLIDEGITGHELVSDASYVRYGYEENRKTIHIYNVGTPNPENKNKGYATQLLDRLFDFASDIGAAISVDSYTTSGRMYIKHVMKRLAEKYKVHFYDQT